VPRRLDLIRFSIHGDEIEVAFVSALELAERAARADDDDARSAAAKIRGAGASRPVKLSPAERIALARVIDAWERDAATVRRLQDVLLVRGLTAEELGRPLTPEEERIGRKLRGMHGVANRTAP
jgi:hypothetical protein